jgi:hypothetical protein
VAGADGRRLDLSDAPEILTTGKLQLQQLSCKFRRAFGYRETERHAPQRTILN